VYRSWGELLTNTLIIPAAELIQGFLETGWFLPGALLSVLLLPCDLLGLKWRAAVKENWNTLEPTRLKNWIQKKSRHVLRHTDHGTWIVLPVFMLYGGRNFYKATAPFDKAMAMFREKERLCRQLNNLQGLAGSLGGQARIFRFRGELHRAMPLYQEEERICRRLGYQSGAERAARNCEWIAKQPGMEAESDGAPLDSIPKSLKDTPREKRLVEQFGWQPFVWGFALLLALRVSRPINLAGEIICFGFGLVGLALVLHEIFRRINNTTLVADGNKIGIYRLGRLREVLPRYALGPYIANGFVLLMRDLQIPFLAGLANGCILTLVFPLLMFVWPLHNSDNGFWIGMFVVGVILFVSLLSVFRTKFFRCRALILKNGRRKKILLRARDLEKIS
jgi:hypothetical protein